MLELATSARIKTVLQEAAQSSSLPKDLCSEAKELLAQSSIPWARLKVIVEAVRQQHDGEGPWLHELCQGSCLQLPRPAQKVKPPELQARLAKLQEQADNKRYAEMVADITQKEREAEEKKDAILPSSRLQISFGLNVLVTMGTFYILGYYVCKYYLRTSESTAAIVGVAGFSFGLLMETTLLIIRSNRLKPLEETMPHLFDPKLYDPKYAAKQQKQQAAANATQQKHSSGASTTAMVQESKKRK